MNFTLVFRSLKYSKNSNFSCLFLFQGVISCRIKPNKFFFLVFLVEKPIKFPLISENFIFYWIYGGLCNSSLIEEIFNMKIWKKTFHEVFLQFLEPPDLEKKISTTWNVHRSEVYLACINFRKFCDNLKACLEVIRFPSWYKNVKFSANMQFFTFLTSWKINFWINDKFEI